jgi:hypothetical protein
MDLEKALRMEEAQTLFWKKKFDQAVQAHENRERHLNEEIQKLEAKLHASFTKNSCYCSQLVQAIQDAELKHDFSRIQHLRRLAHDLSDLEQKDFSTKSKKKRVFTSRKK